MSKYFKNNSLNFYLQKKIFTVFFHSQRTNHFWAIGGKIKLTNHIFRHSSYRIELNNDNNQKIVIYQFYCCTLSYQFIVLKFYSGYLFSLKKDT